MTVQDNSIIKPTPSAELLAEKERKWRLVLPSDYKNFVMNYNGCIPNETAFECDGHEYAVTRFLCILKSFEESQYGDYDISVVESEIGERLTDNEDLIGVEVLPIAELFAGDYACLDFRENKDKPTVCVWSHDNSEEFAPVTYKAADSFSEFIDMLKG